MDNSQYSQLGQGGMSYNGGIDRRSEVMVGNQQHSGPQFGMRNSTPFGNDHGMIRGPQLRQEKGLLNNNDYAFNHQRAP